MKGAEMAEETRILVADDEVRGVELLKRGLRKLGQIDGALSGEEAWERFQLAEYHLVISDQRMPGMSGVELLSRVAAEREHTGRIILTGYADFDATVEAINCGHVHAYLSKPCDPRDLHLTVRGVLDRVSLARENARLVETLTGKNAALEEALQSLREAQARVLSSEKLAAIGRMAAMIVHDLRGPLTVLRSSGNAIVRDGAEMPSEELREIGSDVLDEAERMQRLCAELQNLTQAGTDGGRYAEAALDELITSALSAFTEEASHQGVRVEFDLQAEDELSIDADRFRRALLNLCYNALDAMPDGGLLRVATRSDREEVRLSVIDSGCGIPDEIRERIFEPFVTAGKARGSGLGLAVVKKVVDDHGGQVRVGKTEGGGTAFHLSLPRARSQT
jgi:signal transduction histidine kinase